MSREHWEDAERILQWVRSFTVDDDADKAEDDQDDGESGGGVAAGTGADVVDVAGTDEESMGEQDATDRDSDSGDGEVPPDAAAHARTLADAGSARDASMDGGDGDEDGLALHCGGSPLRQRALSLSADLKAVLHPHQLKAVRFLAKVRHSDCTVTH
jgi:hypothetical protein